MKYETISLQLQEKIAHLRFERPQARNAINARMIAECRCALATCEQSASVVILSGSPEFFCVGADFKELGDSVTRNSSEAEQLYDVWSRLAAGPFVSVAHVRGRVNAGGVGFVAASDIVLADEGAQFSLSELLFGLMPACVLPFLVRRVGFQRAHYLTLMTQPINARTAQQWGLVDVWDARSEDLLRRHLLRLRRLTKSAIRRYKSYASELSAQLEALKPRAVTANVEVFSDPENRAAIRAYANSGLFPWER